MYSCSYNRLHASFVSYDYAITYHITLHRYTTYARRRACRSSVRRAIGAASAAILMMILLGWLRLGWLEIH